MKCKCGYQNSEGAVFCAGCGRKLNGKKTSKLQWFLLIVLVFLVIALCVVIAKGPNNATSLEATAPAHTPNATSENIHIHSWQDATCENPQTCTTCKEKQGVALGHSWEAATCAMPQVCKVCGKTVGEALNHQWKEATYDAPKTCGICGATEGELNKPDIRVNDIVVFGTYEQDGIIQNGAEGIEWLVLDVQDNYALLLSRYALDSQRYHKVTAQVSWNNCSLREWLNNDFMNAAFTKSQQEVILKTGLDNDASVDRIFILGSKEVDRYVTDWNALLCAPTSYAVSRGAGKNQPDGSRDTVSWWLRSLDAGGSQAYCMSFKGEQYTYMVGNDFMSVRPAMCIDLSKAVWE